MTYAHKKEFVLRHLADGKWHSGMEIVEASKGQVLQRTAYQTLGRMEDEQLIKSKRDAISGALGRTVDRLYQRRR